MKNTNQNFKDKNHGGILLSNLESFELIMEHDKKAIESRKLWTDCVFIHVLQYDKETKEIKWLPAKLFLYEDHNKRFRFNDLAGRIRFDLEREFFQNEGSMSVCGMELLEIHETLLYDGLSSITVHSLDFNSGKIKLQKFLENERKSISKALSVLRKIE